jgi:hypothetical protein
MKRTINGLQNNEEITAIIRIRKTPDTHHVLTVLTQSVLFDNPVLQYASHQQPVCIFMDRLVGFTKSVRPHHSLFYTSPIGSTPALLYFMNVSMFYVIYILMEEKEERFCWLLNNKIARQYRNCSLFL